MVQVWKTLSTIQKAQAETGEVKGHYLNATAGTSEGMLYRAETAKMLGVPIIMHDYITGGFTSNTSMDRRPSPSREGPITDRAMRNMRSENG